MDAIKEELEYRSVHVVTDDGVDIRIVGMDFLIAVKGQETDGQPFAIRGNRSRDPRAEQPGQLLQVQG
jgi:hypothetical protein